MTSVCQFWIRLIDQLEKVAEAGIGDVSKVTAAQRTVSTIRVEKTSVAEGLAQAQLDFSNAFWCH